MNKGRVVVAIATILLLSTLLTPVRAGWVRTAVTKDRISVEASLKVDITKIPVATYNFYRAFINTYIKHKLHLEKIEEKVKEGLEKWLRTVKGYENAVVEELKIDLDLDIAIFYVSLHPDANKTVAGTWVSGNLSDLTDGTYMRFRSYNDTNTMKTVVEYNITIPSDVISDEVYDKISEIKLRIIGNLSKTVSDMASIEVYNFTSGTYTLLNSSALNVTSPTEVILTISPAYAPERIIRLRINITDVQSHPSQYVDLDIDLIEAKVYYQSIALTSYFKLVVSGVSTTTLTGRYINAKLRYLKPVIRTSYGPYSFYLHRMFMMDLSAFDVPLEKWSRRFNGTHTIFTYSIDYSITLETGAIIKVDPEQTLVVEGEATAEGDTIFVKEYTTEFWMLIAGVAVAITVLILIAIRVRKKALITEPRKYLVMGDRR